MLLTLGAILFIKRRNA
ncbi:hypothetical protein EJ131_31895 [Bacillus mycoides]|nr:hypothetical protein [Bacillus mycoides]